MARDHARFALPLSLSDVGVGDIVALPEAGGQATFRIDHIDHSDAYLVHAGRVEDAIYAKARYESDPVKRSAAAAPVPVYSVFMDPAPDAGG